MIKESLLSQNHPDYIELIQLTDTHIFSDLMETFDGIDTAKSLSEVIARAKTGTWPPDAILVTGDLVHDTGTQAYERLAGILMATQRPVFCIPGNHDEPGLMHKILNRENISTTKTIIFDQWIILMLDTFIPDTHAGYLNKGELDFLDQALHAHADKHALICLHHPPVSIGSPWMDRMGLQNPEDLFSVIDQHERVRAVLWGHIHQEFNSMHKEVRLMSAPSTCVQFSPKVNEYTRDNQTAGYRNLKLYASGVIQTEVVRVGHS